jgi:hypothetical protein
MHGRKIIHIKRVAQNVLRMCVCVHACMYVEDDDNDDDDM